MTSSYQTHWGIRQRDAINNRLPDRAELRLWIANVQTHLDKPLSGHGSQRRPVAGSHAKLLEYILRDGVAGVDAAVQLDAGLGDGPPKQAASSRHSQQGLNAHRTEGLAKHGHVVRVSAIGSDLVSHPRKGGHRIEQSKIATLAGFVKQFVEVEKTKEAESIVDGDEDHIVAHERGSIVKGPATAGADTTTTMKPDHGWPLSVIYGRCPHIQGEAILVQWNRDMLRPGKNGGGGSAHLGTRWPELRRFSYTLPRLGWLGGAEAPWADRWCGKWNAFEGDPTFKRFAPDGARCSSRKELGHRYLLCNCIVLLSCRSVEGRSLLHIPSQKVVGGCLFGLHVVRQPDCLVDRIGQCEQPFYGLFSCMAVRFLLSTCKVFTALFRNV